MEVNGFDLIGFDLFGVDLNSIDINTDNSVSVKDDYIPLVQNPYIKGHITTSDNTFTFIINNTDVTVNVDANGNFKYKPTVTITSLSFVCVPQLESLELFKINGVTSFNVDYPTNVTFIRCDSTTKNAKNDVYHIRGTATDDFDFTLKYIDDNNTVTTVTESAIIDSGGNWDVSYSGKKIRELKNTFKDKTEIKTIFLTEDLSEVIDATNAFYVCDNMTDIQLPNAVLSKCTSIERWMTTCSALSKIDLPKATFNAVTKSVGAFYTLNVTEIKIPNGTFENLLLASQTWGGMFQICEKLKTLDLSSATFASVTDITYTFHRCYALTELIVPDTRTLSLSVSFSMCPLSYESMLRVAGWLKDLSGGTAQTVTFRKATYDALTAEQKATLQGIIVTQKNWILATA